MLNDGPIHYNRLLFLEFGAWNLEFHLNCRYFAFIL